MSYRTLDRLVAAGTSFTNTAAETELYGYTFPADFWQVGKVVRMKAAVVVTAENTTDTIGTFVRFGATGLGDTALFTSLLVDSAVADVGFVDVDLICRTTGSAGTFEAVVFGSDVDAPHAVLSGPAVTNVTAIDTTASTRLVFSGIWSAADAGNVAAAQYGVTSEIID